MNKKIILALLLVAFLAVPVAVPVAVPAENSLMSIASSSVINIATATTVAEAEAEAEAEAVVDAPTVGVVEVIADLINVLFFILVTVAAIFVIMGAFTILTAQGDPEKMGTGRTQITYAIVAVVVAIAAQGIIAFIRAQIAA